MKILLTDIVATTRLLDIDVETTDEAIRSLLSDHEDLLIKMGLDKTWLQENGDQEFKYFTPQWDHNVRIVDWHVCYSVYDSDDEIVTAYIVDPEKASRKYSIIFMDVSGEPKIFESDGKDELNILKDIQRQIKDIGFEWSTEDVEALYSKDWIRKSLLNYDSFHKIFDDVWEIEWSREFKESDFSGLRCFIFNNH